MSVTMTVSTWLGPRLVTVTVYVTGFPAVATVRPSSLVIATSAP